MDDAEFNRTQGAGIILNSLPKAGTHLIAKALRHLPGVTPDAACNLWAKDAVGDGAAPIPGTDAVLVGMTTPRPCPAAVVKARIDGLAPGRFAVWHVPFGEAVGDLVGRSGRKVVLSMRDPRDVVVSHYFYALRPADNFLCNLARAEGKDRFMELLIRGIPDEDGGGWRLAPLSDGMDQIARWRDALGAVVIRFEDIVGEPGGGSAVAQRAALERLCEGTGLRCAGDRLAEIAAGLHGGTVTFRQGRSGGWQEHLSPANLKLLERLCAERMAEFGYRPQGAA